MFRTFLIASFSATLIILMGLVFAHYRVHSDIALRLAQPILPLSKREIEPILPLSEGEIAIRMGSLETLRRSGLVKADRVLETSDEVPAEYAKLWDRMSEPYVTEKKWISEYEGRPPIVDVDLISDVGLPIVKFLICGTNLEQRKTDAEHQDERLRIAILNREPPEVIAALVDRHPFLRGEGRQIFDRFDPATLSRL